MGTAIVFALLALPTFAQHESAGGHDMGDHGKDSQASNGGGRQGGQASHDGGDRGGKGHEFATYGAQGERPDPGIEPDKLGIGMLGGWAGGLIDGARGAVAGAKAATADLSNKKDSGGKAGSEGGGSRGGNSGGGKDTGGHEHAEHEHPGGHDMSH